MSTKGTSTFKTMAETMDVLSENQQEVKQNTGVLLICAELRAGNAAAATEQFRTLLSLELSDSEFLRVTQQALTYALRRHQQHLFVTWLQLAAPRLDALMTQSELCAECSSWLLGTVFAACDRRLLQPLLRHFLLQWLRCNRSNAVAVQQLLAELLHLAVRMARRGWLAEKAWLLKIVFHGAWQQRDVKQWRQLLNLFVLHFIGYAKWDGFPHACQVYEEIHLLLLLLLRRTTKKHLSSEVRQELLQLVLRSARTLVVNCARSTMQDDLEVFRQWYQYLHQTAGDNTGRKQQFMQLLQLSILYWNATLPKSSRKQVRYLQDLLAPDYVGAEYHAILEKVL